MSVLPLKEFIMENQNPITIGVTHKRLQRYFKEDIWQDHKIIGWGYRDMCYFDAGNQWGHKFTKLADPTDNRLWPLFAIALGSLIIALASVPSIFTIAARQFQSDLFVVSGSTAAFCLLFVIPGVYYAVKNSREVGKIASKEIFEKDVEDLVEQIIKVLEQRPYLSEKLIPRIRNGEKIEPNTLN